MKRVMVLACAMLVLTVLGCAGAGLGPTYGLLSTDVKYPALRTAVENDGVGTKVGTSMSKNVLGWVATGDCSMAAAMKNGGITKVHTVDYHVMNILGVYAEYTTIVTGE